MHETGENSTSRRSIIDALRELNNSLFKCEEIDLAARASEILSEADGVEEILLDLTGSERSGTHFLLYPTDESGGGMLVRLKGDRVLSDAEVALLEATALNVGQFMQAKKLENKSRETLANLESILDETVEAISLVTEARDPYTAGHSRRVALLATAIAREMCFPGERIKGVHITGLLHDIGKVSIPVELLTRRGRIKRMEFGVIRSHPQVGFDTLKGIGFPWPVAQAVLQHHERLDGSGYPASLSGDDVILEARILGVADSVEAMANHRPYRAARGIDRALDEVSSDKGKLYDPEVVEACITVFQKRGFSFY